MIAFILFLYVCLLNSECLSSGGKVKVCRRKDRLITARKTELYEIVDAINFQEIILLCHYCSEIDNLEPKIWYKQIRPFLKDPEEIKVTKILDLEESRIVINAEHSLIIKNYSSNDEGIYYCRERKRFEAENKLNYLVDTIIDKIDHKLEIGDALRWKNYEEKYLIPVNELMRTKIKEYRNINRNYDLETKLEVITQWEPWGPCIICGLTMGQKRRLGKCRLHATTNKSTLTKARHVRMQVIREDESISQDSATDTISSNRDVINTSSSIPSEKLTIGKIFRSTPTLSCRSFQIMKAEEINQELFEKIAAIPEFVQIESCYGVCEEGRNLKMHPEDGVATNRKRVWEDEMSYEEREIMEEYSEEARGVRYIHLKKGDRLTLVCPGASASSVVVWKKNGKVIGASGLMDYGTVDALGTLRVEKVGADDTGSYLCTVDGSDAFVVSVEVKVSKYLSVQDYLRHSTYIFIIFGFVSVVYCSRVAVEYYTRYRRRNSGYYQVNQENDVEDFDL